jgi:predicted ATP-dependent endonuclease of OLD family
MGNMPIIIDEPEAHLDSSLIAKYLVNLVKQRKQHRQIIFATHNANFVINGDADLVYCMHMGDDHITRATPTTIENLSHRELLLALEGGEMAFQQRERRYGID